MATQRTNPAAVAVADTAAGGGEDGDRGAGGGAGNTAAPANPKTKRPKDSAFKQQRLPAWQPILTAGTVLPTFFVIGVAFVPIGIGMLHFSDQVQELKFDYTNCEDVGTGSDCSTVIGDEPGQPEPCTCHLNFTLAEAWTAQNVYMYYGLTNFYQNHRRYVKSRDDSQLLGVIGQTPSDDCEPFDVDEVSKKPYAPCGAIANSLFSDDIELVYQGPDDADYGPVELIRRGIAWESDRKYKFKNPPGSDTQEALKDNLKDTAKPRDWHKNLWELDPKDPENNGFQNEDLIVWMRTAALPNFRKLYRKIDHNQDKFKDGLPAGKYEFRITYRFRVTQFSGKKSVIISTTSVLGGKNPFLGIAYITVGSICLLMGVVFLFIHVKCGKQTNEMMNISSRTHYN